MITLAAGRTAAGTHTALSAFVLAALVVLTPPLIARELVSPAGIVGLLDWTICAASTSTSGRPGTVPTVTGSEPLAAELHKRITSMIVEFPPNAFSPEHHHEAGKAAIRLKLKNPSSSVAFQIHPRLTKGKDGDDLVPIFWDDNYFSLLPGEEKTVSVTFDSTDLDGKDPVLELEGFNIAPATIKISR